MQPNIKIVGVGGQGVVTAGIIIAEAYKIEGINVVMSEIHGLSQRGGSVSVDIRSGNVKSSFSRYSEIDLLLAFEPLEAARYFPVLHQGTAVLISNEKLAPVWLGIRRMGYPDLANQVRKASGRLKIQVINAVDLAYKAGNYRAVNSVLVGAAFGLDLLGVQKNNLLSALKDTLGDRGLDINMRAFEAGAESVTQPGNTTPQPKSPGKTILKNPV